MSATIPTNSPSDQPLATSVNLTDILLLDQAQPGGVYATRSATVAELAQAVSGALSVVAGAQGAAGSQGLQGQAGAQGVPGNQGYQGPPGVAGSIGPIGPGGPQGSTGEQGSQGLPGVSGSPGAAGAPGATGAAGAPGANGAQGIQGEIGPVGPDGPAFDPAGADISLGVVNLPNASKAVALQRLFALATPIEALGGAAGGVVDNGPALVKAAGLGIPVVLGAGTYLVDGECDLVSGAVLISGIPGQTIVTRNVQGTVGAANTAPFGSNPAWIFFNAPTVVVVGVIFDGNAALTSSVSWGLLIGPGVVSSEFDRVFVRNVKGNGYAHGMHYKANANGSHSFWRGGSSNNAIHGISGGAVIGLSIKESEFTENGYSGIILDAQSGTPVGDFDLEGNLVTSNGSTGIQIGAADVPGSSDPTVIYGSAVMHASFGRLVGNVCDNNVGYDLEVAASQDVIVSGNWIGAMGFNGNCSVNLRFEHNVVDAGSSTAGTRIGVDIGGAIQATVNGNMVRGGWLIGITCGGTTNARVTRNQVVEGLGSCIAVLNAESGGVGGGGTSPFGPVCSGLVIEGNELDYSLGGNGINMLDAPVGVGVTDNLFIDSQLRADSMVVGYAPLLRARGNRLMSSVLVGAAAIGGVTALPAASVTSANMLVLPLGSDELVLTGAPGSTSIGEVETSMTAALAGQVTKISATAGGSGYGVGTTCTISGDGTGAAANVLVYAGKVIAFSMTNGGSGYSHASVVINGVGTGASAGAIVGGQDPFDFDQVFAVTNLTGAAMSITAGAISTPGGGNVGLAVNRTAVFRMPNGNPVLCAA